VKRGYNLFMIKAMRFFRLFRVWRSFGTALKLMRSRRVPLHLKVITAVLAVLIISPLNILGDIPFLGLFDDVALLSVLAGWFVSAAARHDALTTIEGELVAMG
jgi:uncharacterized membrane protein YkvA (DUF1232 family)